jgi:hypothetical protein
MFQCADYDRKTSTSSQKVNVLQEAAEKNLVVSTKPLYRQGVGDEAGVA